MVHYPTNYPAKIAWGIVINLVDTESKIKYIKRA